ncbi:type VI secretion system tube protein TssD [Paraburkholderia diazotrophica]|uniref:Type VI secretion system secreted protein Hcp n=1 Tax=Paraburkholderia diazotrophica TaxID=667676 RepID=A0A1H6YIT8_9BURK|nr:type VI secretion system tube protein TssD [Paraburkholderia diazotrophica]SEJ41228.1 type VI secretion system secreted protein Hcp [Paraburkholderia diazotrophica]
MPTPLHLWLKDERGAAIRGSSTVAGREGSIEVLSLTHSVHAPTDNVTGKLIGGRSHRPITIEKEVDRSSVLLNQAVVRGQTLASAELKWYRTNDAGKEEEYYNITMRNVKVVSVSPKVPNIKEDATAHRNHFEIVEFRCEEIAWSYLDGNLKFTDAWTLI